MRKKESGGLGPKHKKVLGGHCPKLDLTRNLHGKPRDALGRRAAAGVPDSQSASERGESAPARKAPANKAGVIWWSTDAEKRKRRQKGASPGGS